MLLYQKVNQEERQFLNLAHYTPRAYLRKSDNKLNENSLSSMKEPTGL